MLGGPGRANAGVVDQDIGSSLLLDDPGGKIRDLLGVGHVGRMGMGVFAQFLRSKRQLGIDIDQMDPRSLGDQRAGGSQPDAIGRARYHHNFLFEFEHAASLPSGLGQTRALGGWCPPI